MPNIELNDLLNILKKTCKDQNIELSAPITDKTFDMALIKPLTGSNTGSKGSINSNQSCILLTGNQFTLFPVIKRASFNDSTIGKNIIIKVCIELCSNNINYLNKKSTTSPNEIIQSYLTTNETTNNRVELGCKTLDDPIYVDFYNSSCPGDYLIICKYASQLNYLFLMLRNSDAISYSELLRENSKLIKKNSKPDTFTYFNNLNVSKKTKDQLTYVSSQYYSYAIDNVNALKKNNSLTYDVIFKDTIINRSITMASLPSIIVQHHLNNLTSDESLKEISKVFDGVTKVLTCKDFIITKDKIPTDPNRKGDFKIVTYNGAELGVYSEIYGSGKKENFLAMIKEFELLDYKIIPHRLSGGINKIFLGAPGTGKSKLVNDTYKNEKHVRVLFHPEYTYNDFIGYLKPCKNGTDINYEFTPGPFTKILAQAINTPNEMFTLIIEEINRANISAVFGDVFQLLDRDSSGASEYSIYNADIFNYIASIHNVCVPIENDTVILPSNLNIIATMNPADQNVFPMDTAFKRRWEFEYIPVKFKDNHKFKNNMVPQLNLEWEVFANKVNDFMMSPENQELMLTEDKQLGPYFIKESDLEDTNKFAYKVLLYLWDDVFKGDRSILFNDSIRTFSKIIDIFNSQDPFNIFSSTFKGILKS